MCVSCNPDQPDQCLNCNTGYYLNNGTCMQCPSNCDTCSSTGTCSSFKLSTRQFGIRIGNKTVPAICDPGCKRCSNEEPSKCITCYSGYSLQLDDTCSPCEFPCKTCSTSNVSSCLSCYSNAFLTQTTNENGTFSTCSKCTSSSNCLTCDQDNLDQCITCPYGFSMNTTSKTCVRGCPNNCLSCSSASVCTLCIKGYAPNSNGTCMPCLSTCRDCSSQAPGVCISCGTGFFLNSQQSCQVCQTPFCMTCSEIGCSACMPGYTLTSDFTCAKNCKAPCSTCSSTSPTSCTSCLAGYNFN